MKHKVLVKPNELYIGMRVKCPVAGWWCGYPHKKQLWFKGVVKEIGRRNDTICSVVIYLTSKKHSSVGRMMFLGSQVKTDIYKVL